MRVAIVSPYALDVFGGVQSQALGIGRELAASCDVLVVAPGPSGPRAGLVVKGVGAYVSIPANGSRAPIALAPAAWRATRKALEAFAPDVIHVHEPFVPLVGLAAATSELAPVVATFHRAGSGRLYPVLRPLLMSTYRGLAARVAVSLEAAETLRSLFGEREEPVEILSNGIDVARFERAAHLKGVVPSVVFVGRHEQRKGLSVLLEAFSDDLGARLIVVGTGPQFDQLRRRYARPGMVEFLGPLDDEQMANAVASADVLVAPSLGGESFGVVLLEAMAAGTAVVASDLPGYRLAAGDAARFFPRGDVVALRAALRELLTDPLQRGELVARGSSRASSHSFSALAARYAEIYRGVLR